MYVDDNLTLLRPLAGLDRATLYNLGVTLANATLTLSGIDTPTYRTYVSDDVKFRDGWGHFGYYRFNVVNVNVTKSRPVTKTPGFSWTFPGWKADLTALGVVAHEVGHYVHDQFRAIDTRHWRSEAPVTSYEPNHYESFAEAVKLFMTNPDLLRVGRPLRYATLTSILEPPHLVPWRDVLTLRGAHEKFISAAGNWIARKR